MFRSQSRVGGLCQQKILLGFMNLYTDELKTHIEATFGTAECDEIISAYYYRGSVAPLPNEILDSKKKST